MSYGANNPSGVPLGLPSIVSLGLAPLVNPYPALDLDFINNQTLDSRVTFSRGSQATLFDSTGTLRYAKHNLLLQSQDFASGDWTKSNSSITSNTEVAPDGTLTADVLTGNGTSNTHGVQNTTALSFIAATHTISIFAKAGTNNFIQLRFFGVLGGAFANFDLANGVVGTSGNGGSGVIQSVGNGWYRCAMTATTSASASGGFNFLLVTSASAAGNETNTLSTNVYIWGAQLNLANMEGGVTSSLTTYYPTTTAAYYAPRFDYNPSTLQPLGLLIEEQRTNSIRNNTMQGAVAGTPGTLPTNWSVFTSLTGLTRQVVETGTENGITYIDIRLSGTPSASGDYQIFPESLTNVVASSGQTWAHSSYYKLQAGTMTGVSDFQISIQERDNAGNYLAGSFTNQITPSATTRRGESVRTLNNASTTRVSPGFRIVLSGAAIDITLRIGLPQLEQGAFATSVIPTTTTALTRNADVASMTGTNFSSWYNASEGTIYAELQSLSTLTPAQSVAVNRYPELFRFVQTSTATNIIWYGTAAELYIGGVYNNLGSVVVGGINKVAVGMAASGGQSASSLNGAAAVNRSGTNSTAPTAFGLGSNGSGTSTTFLNGTIRRIAYYPTRLPNTTLQALTA